METFNLIVNQKQSVWERLYVSVEANSLEEAAVKCSEGEYTINDSEILYDCVECLDPTESNPVTLEVFKEDDTSSPIFTNSIYIQ